MGGNLITEDYYEEDQMNVKHLYLEDGIVNPSLYASSFVIWGTGGDGERLYHLLPEAAKVKMLCFVDSDKKKVNTKRYGKIIRHPSELQAFQGDVNIALAFNAWPETMDALSFHVDRVFADFRYEYEPSGERSCIICGGTCIESRAHFAPFIAEREFLGCPPETKLVTCKNCGFSYSFYRPSDEEMERLYVGYRNEEYYTMRHKYEPHYTRDENERCGKSEYILLRQKGLQEFVSEYISGVETVLDYGGDKGEFIPEQFSGAKKYVFEISGVKPCDGVKNIRHLVDLLNRQFDFVMCCHLLEHVANPIEIGMNLERCTAQCGYIYVEVPYETKFLRYSDYAFHEHINFFTEEALEAFGKRLRLCVVKKDILGGSILRMLYGKNVTR